MPKRPVRKIVIIGGGAAGLAAAVSALRNGADVTVVEHKEAVGKKLLKTGNGHCNYTNTNVSPEHYHGDDALIGTVLGKYGCGDIIDFMCSLGIEPKTRKYGHDDGGYIYPHSMEAVSVRNAMLFEIESCCGTILRDTEVLSVKSSMTGFTVETSSGTLPADRVIIATGSNADPATGSDSSAYALIRRTGHSFQTFKPALCPVKCSPEILEKLAGVRVDASVTLSAEDEENAFYYTRKGEVQFSQQGISGIPVMDLSRFVPLYLEQGFRVRMQFDFLPDADREFPAFYLNRSITRAISAKKQFDQVMAFLLPAKLSAFLCAASGTTGDLELLMRKFTVDITGTAGFDRAQCCSGGVPASEISADTMESQFVEGLYFAGEVLDVDGDCGGYNLHWALATGILAGVNAAL